MSNKNYKDLQAKIKAIALHMGLEPCDKPYEGAFTFPSGYHQKSEEHQKFFTFVCDQMLGEQWYFHPEFARSFDWQIFAYSKIAHDIQKFVSETKDETDFQDRNAAYQKFLDKYESAIFQNNCELGFDVVHEMVTWYAKTKN